MESILVRVCSQKNTVQQVGTIPDIPNMHNLLPNIGYRFGHQSGLDESQRRKPTTFLDRLAFRVHLGFSIVGILITYDQTQNVFVEVMPIRKKQKIVGLQKEQKPAASLQHRKQGSGIPIHIQMSLE